jgi:hypothetical protein
MRLTVLLLLVGACSFQVAGLPVSPKTDPDPVTPSTPPSTTPPASTPPASTPTPSDPQLDLSQLPDLATASDMTRLPDLAPMPIDCSQDCTVSVPGGISQIVICEAGQTCDLRCGPGSHCTLDCRGDAKCECEGMGCAITDCAPVQRCKGGVLVCNEKCPD